MELSAEHQLLFALIAQQMGFINRDQLTTATAAWINDKSRPLADFLMEQGALCAADHELLEVIVARHIDNHGNDPTASIAALSSIACVADDLTKIGDSELMGTLSMIAPDHSSHAFPATVVPDAPAGSTRSQVDLQNFDGHRFRILRPHAKGGLGEVSLAKDLELNRDVALKEIQARFAHDAASRSRFLLEAEVTGGLEHPGIVPVYGLGQYADGRPYYAMRFIQGDSLQEAADRFHGNNTERLDPTIDFEGIEFRKLLGRFIDVCQAIEYAHSRGVLHRDLKPGNIMLGKYGETLVVDWGLAKTKTSQDASTSNGEPSLQPASASGSAPTMMGSAIGTPAFMPPEQAAGRLDELGPASDVYSLGATLYYLLTGKAPFRGKLLQDVLDQVRTGDFPTPLSIQPRAPKALQAICLKAMSLRAADRYATPQRLADDVERYLADEPVTSHSEPLSVITRRWVRKHPKIVASMAATLMVGLTSAIVVSTIVAGKNQQLDRKNDELDQTNVELAESNEQLILANESERRARSDAESARSQAETVTEFLVNAFRRADPTVDSRDIRVVDVLDRAVTNLDRDYPDPSQTKAKLQDALGSTYVGLGDYRRAIPLLTAGHRYLSETLGDESAEAAAALANLASVHHEMGNNEIAIDLNEKALAALLESLGPDDDRTLSAQNNLAAAYRAMGGLPKALPLMERTLASMVRLNGEDHELTLIARNNLASVYQLDGQSEQAIPHFERSLKSMREQFGEEDVSTLMIQNNLGQAYAGVGRKEDALRLLIVSLDGLKSKLGDTHPYVFQSLLNTAFAYQAIGDFDNAITRFEQARESSSQIHGAESPYSKMVLDALAFAQLNAGHDQQAVLSYEQLLGPTVDDPQWDSPEIFSAYLSLIDAYLATQDRDKARPLAKKLWLKLNTQPPPSATAMAQVLLRVGLSARGLDNDAARSALQECIDVIDDPQTPPSWVQAIATSALGELELADGRHQDAELLLRSAYDSLSARRHEMPVHQRHWLDRTVRHLTQLFEATGNDKELRFWRQRLHEGTRTLAPDEQ